MRGFVIRKSDVDRCPKGSLSASHYREDGSCRCGDETEEEEADVQADD
jgi:hypothetical protein